MCVCVCFAVAFADGHYLADITRVSVSVSVNVSVRVRVRVSVRVRVRIFMLVLGHARALFLPDARSRFLIVRLNDNRRVLFGFQDDRRRYHRGLHLGIEVRGWGRSRG